MELHQDIDKILPQRLAETLPGHVATLLKRIAMRAGDQGWTCYLVAGYIRDALLARAAYDVDVSVEGDAAEIATDLADEAGLQIQIYEKFGTATLALAEGLHLDVVTARKESYPQPGALPHVEAGTIMDDLARRDFTINALALPVLPGRFGNLLDPHGGVQDMQARLIRVLHSQSFRDDPTRIFRAVKLARRLGFKIERDTLELILQAVRDNALGTVSIDRIMRELWLILDEAEADAVLADLDRLGVLAAIHPSLSWHYEPGKMRPGERADASREMRRNAYLATIAAEFASDPHEAELLARWLHLPTPAVRLMRDAAKLAQVWPRLSNEELRPSQVYRMLHELEPGAVEAYGQVDALAQDATAWARLQHYLQTTRHTRAQIGGDFIKGLGVEPGPIYKEATAALLDALLDGEVGSKQQEEEEAFVRRWLRERGLAGVGQGGGRQSGTKSGVAPHKVPIKSNYFLSGLVVCFFFFSAFFGLLSPMCRFPLS